jgi:hypothetical protein
VGAFDSICVCAIIKKSGILLKENKNMNIAGIKKLNRKARLRHLARQIEKGSLNLSIFSHCVIGRGLRLIGEEFSYSTVRRGVRTFAEFYGVSIEVADLINSGRMFPNRYQTSKADVVAVLRNIADRSEDTTANLIGG